MIKKVRNASVVDNINCVSSELPAQSFNYFLSYLFAQMTDDIGDIAMTSTEADSSQTQGHEGK